jgi:hypothetical protein
VYKFIREFIQTLDGTDMTPPAKTSLLGSNRVARLKKRAHAVESARSEVSHKAIGYIRVGSDEQANTGFGLVAQEAAIRAFAASQGYELIDVFSDPGVAPQCDSAIVRRHCRYTGLFGVLTASSY